MYFINEKKGDWGREIKEETGSFSLNYNLKQSSQSNSSWEAFFCQVH